MYVYFGLAELKHPLSTDCVVVDARAIKVTNRQGILHALKEIKRIRWPSHIHVFKVKVV